jgi:hypothetical protein
MRRKRLFPGTQSNERVRPNPDARLRYEHPESGHSTARAFGSFVPRDAAQEALCANAGTEGASNERPSLVYADRLGHNKRGGKVYATARACDILPFSDLEECMQTVMIQAPVEDADFFEKLRQQGVNVEVFEVERFEGLSEVIQAVVTITAAITPLLIAYLKEDTSRAKNRLIIVDGKKIRLSGYSAEDAEKLLKSKRADDHD